jgi:hypothetical protein
MSLQENVLIIMLIRLINSMYRRSGDWVPERGIFWECDSETEGGDSDEETTTGSCSDGNGSDNSSDGLEAE